MFLVGLPVYVNTFIVISVYVRACRDVTKINN